MNTSIHKICTAIIICTLSACNLNNVLSDPGFSIDDKVTFDSIRQLDPQSILGAQEHPKVLENYGGIYESEKLEGLLVSILGRLIEHLPDNAPAFSITILDSPAINAFALPGGYLYITRGLIALANDESEIAAVLAHEIAHVQKSHGVERTIQARNVTIVERVVNEVVSNEIAGKVAKASAQQKLVVFSQTQELQADEDGIDILAKAGFDPLAAARFLQTMDQFDKWKKDFGKNENDISNFHPPTPKRIKLATKHAEKYKNNIRQNNNKEAFLESIDGLMFGDKENEGLILNNRYSHSGLSITFEVPRTFQMFNRPEAIVAVGPNEEALRFDAVTIPFEEQKPEEYIKSGWVKGLKHESIRKKEINFFNAATAQSLAGEWQFAIAVVEVRKRYFRFVLAAPEKNKNIENIFNNIIRTFRDMSQFEKNNIKPLKIKIHEITQNDTMTELLQPMQNMHKSSELFKAINGLAPQQNPRIGDKVKIITP